MNFAIKGIRVGKSINVNKLKSTATLLCSLMVLLGVVGCNDEQLTTVSARVDDFHVTVKANGELASAQTAFLSPPSVKRMWRYKLNFLMPEGTPVKKGQVVARFETNTVTDKLKRKKDELSTLVKELENKVLQQEKDSEDLKVQLAQREVGFRQAERKASQIDQTTSKIETQKLRYDLQIATQDLALYKIKVERQTAKAALDLSIKQREKDVLDAQVSRLQNDLKRLSVRAPKDGLFIYSSNRNGEKSAVGDTLNMGQVFAEIPSLEQMIVKAKITERNLGRLKTGMTVEIVLDANPETKYSGVLVELGSVIQEKARNSPEKVIEAQISIDDPDFDIMRPGMIARLSVVVDTHKDVILLPTQAVELTQGKATVRSKSMFGFTTKEIKVVAFDDQHTAISEGVKAGEEVIL